MTDLDTAGVFPEADPELLPLAAYSVFQLKQGEMLSLMMRLGTRLGLFAALADGTPQNSTDLAALTGLHERWVREWLYAVAAGNVLTHEAAGEDDSEPEPGAERFFLSPEMSVVLAQPDNASYAGGMFDAPVDLATTDRLAEAFRTGVGFSWGDHGHATMQMQASMSGGKQRHHLVPVILASVDGLTERLEAGITMYDVGCGSGVAACTIGAAFPNTTIVGIDPDGNAIGDATARAEAGGLTNVSFLQGTFDDLPVGGADFVLTLDVLHDIPRPGAAAAKVRAALRSSDEDWDGVWYVADIRSSERFVENRRNPMLGLFYAMSVAYCMNSAMSEPDGAGLGTMGLHPERLRGIVEGAGFTKLEWREFEEDISNRYFEIRP